MKEKKLDLPETIEDIEKDPILKPMLDYQKAASLLEEEDKSEKEYKEQKIKILNTLLGTGFYETSLIARRYNDVQEIYKRLLFIYTRYSKMADEKMLEIRKTIDDYYITLKKHKEIIKNMGNPNEEEIKSLREKIMELKEKLKEKEKKPEKEEGEKSEAEIQKEIKRKKYVFTKSR
ncbi:MAG: hypothetical protein KKB31_05860 [Nanoarchaeota archaeon]|nr:hypothetical protein [Nanoarchaeota archaeon]